MKRQQCHAEPQVKVQRAAELAGRQRSRALAARSSLPPTLKLPQLQALDKGCHPIPQLFSDKPELQVTPCTGSSIRCTSASAAASASAAGESSTPKPCSTAATLSRTCEQVGIESTSGSHSIQQQWRAAPGTAFALHYLKYHTKPAAPRSPAAVCRSRPGGWQWPDPSQPP